MGDPIINAQVDDINTTLGNIKVDLAALRPSIRAIKDAIAETYLTDTIENVPIASFPDGADSIPVKNLVVGIEPIQDLNGQTSPYPAGGGVNKFDESVFASYGGVLQTSGVWHFNSLVNILNKTLYTPQAGIGQITVTMWRKQTGIGSQGFRLGINYTDDTSVKVGAQNATGGTDVYSITTDASKTVRNIVGDYGSNQNGTDVNVVVSIGATVPSSYAPYSNICPISGHTEVNVYRTGANLYNTAFEQGNISSSGQNSSSNLAKRLRSTTYNEIGTGTFKLIVQPPFEAFIRTYSTPEIAGYISEESSTTWLSGENEFTLTNAKYVRIVIRYSDDSDITPSDFDATHFYISSAADTYPISLGQTVYGGTLNVTTGVLTINMAEVDLGSLAWSYSSTYGYFQANPTGKRDRQAINYFSSAYKSVEWGYPASTMPDFAMTSTGTNIRIKDSRYSDKDTFKTAVTGVQLVYELATPTTVQLTAAEVETLFGANNVWADANGNIVKLTYRKAWEIALAQGE